MPIMDSKITPLRLVSFAVISSTNVPLYIHSYTGKEDELRYHQLAHAALDLVQEREIPTNRPPENYLGLLYTLDDVVVYGYRTATGLRIIPILALIDGVIKDSDVVIISRAIHQLFARTSSNPFLPLGPSSGGSHRAIDAAAFSPEKVPYVDYQRSRKLRVGAERLGGLLNGGRTG